MTYPKTQWNKYYVPFAPQGDPEQHNCEAVFLGQNIPASPCPGGDCYFSWTSTGSIFD